MMRHLRHFEGSSPLARGLLLEPVGALNSIRIIPARAGFTSDHPPAPVPERDHPRSRGVYRTTYARFPVETGSSPLARGLRGAFVMLGC